VVLCEDIDSELQAVGIAERLAHAVAEPISLDIGEVVVTTSVGISISKASTDTPQGLVRDADAAVYRAKERGRARYELFDHVMRVRAVERLRMENELRRAIEGGQLRVWYQPLVHLDDQRIHSLEALVRWEHPVRGVVLP